MKTYEEYQPSEVEWLDKVPAHWKCIKLKFLFEGWMGGSWGNDPAGDENDLVCVRVADFDFGNRTLKRKDFTVRNFTPSEQASRVLKKGDLILEKSGGGEKTPVGRVVKFDLNEPAICSNFTNRLIPKAAFDSDFLIYLFFALYNNGITVSHINQTTGIQNLQVSSFLDETVFIPTSIPEQRAIAAYLDRKTAQLDTLLAQKEALLQMLHHKRQALINEAVTQGLDPAAPRKPSGVAWLGDVPAHWEVKKLKYLTKLNPSKTLADFGEIVTFLPMEKVGEKGLVDYSLKRPISEVKEGFTYFEREDVIIAKITPCFENGKGAYLKSMDTQVGFGSTEFHVLRASQNLIPSYLYFVTATSWFRDLGEASMTGSAGQKRVPQSFISQFELAFPSVHEQQKIVDFIEITTGQINEATAAIHTQIKTLKAYRQSLISEVVTGKVDVRTAEAVAPEADLPLWRQ